MALPSAGSGDCLRFKIRWCKFYDLRTIFHKISAAKAKPRKLAGLAFWWLIAKRVSV
jgi:hypothetical protein